MQRDNFQPLKRDSKVCLSTAYLAPVEYYSVLVNAETVYLECYDYYVKQSYRNRCQIATANGVMSLSIPVEKTSLAKVLIRDVMISEHNDWQQLHWRSIESAYSSTPFFEYYKDDLFPFYEKKWKFLFDFNQEIQNKVLELMDFQPTVQYTSGYKTFINSDVVDLRESIHPKKENLQQGMKPYYQVFEQRFGFQSNLSVIDLLFNMGNEALLILSD